MGFKRQVAANMVDCEGEGQECFEQTSNANLSNVIQSATLERMAAKHVVMRSRLNAKVAAERSRLQREENDDAKKGLKAMSRRVDGPSATPLLYVKRDEHCGPDHKVGSFTTNPDEIDAVVRRAWKSIYDGSTNDAKGIV